MSQAIGETAGRPATYREVFGVGEYRAMFVAEVVSLLGDQAAAVAVAVLLYQRTGSALVAALGYATAYLPWTVGGLVLSPLADRVRPRRLLVGSDLARAGLIGVAAVPGVPLLVVGLLVLVAAFFAPPFEAGHAALLPLVLSGERYVVGLSLGNVVHQASQLVGFVLGGGLVAVVSANGALALDAVSFVVSAVVLRRGLVERAAAVEAEVAGGRGGDGGADAGGGVGGGGADGGVAGAVGGGVWAELTAGLRVVVADRRRFGPLLLGAVGAGYVIVPEAIAPAYARVLGLGAPAVGVVMAAVAGGTVVGNVVLGRWASAGVRARLMWPMALAGTVPLAVVVVYPGLWVSVGLFAVAGVAGAFQVAANAAFVAAVPVAVRGRAFGVAMTGMYGVQTVAIVAAGAAASVWDPRAVVVVAAVLGALALLVLRATALRGNPPATPAETVGLP